jgi:hypothetical protein
LNANEKEKKERALNKEEKAAQQILVDIWEQRKKFEPINAVVVCSDANNNIQMDTNQMVLLTLLPSPLLERTTGLYRRTKEKKNTAFF